MPHLTGSGSATNAGIDYQQRVAAWYLVDLLFGVDGSLNLADFGKLRVTEVAFETGQNIDDLRLILNDGSVAYLQIKRTLSLSSVPDSDFHKTINQFVTEYLRTPLGKSYYILTISSEASNKIIRELRKILESIRLNDTNFRTNPLNKSEIETLTTFRNIVGEVYKNSTTREITDTDFVNFSKKVYIDVLDVEHDMPLEKVALVLISKESIVNPNLVWSLLIKDSLIFATERQSVNKDGLLQKIGQFLKSSPGHNYITQPEDDLLTLVTGGDFSCGKEYLVVESWLDDSDFLVLELLRFNDDCSKRFHFISPNQCVFSNGKEVMVVHRCSTLTGIERYFEVNKDKYADKEITFISENGIEDIELSACAEAYRELSAKLLSDNKDGLKCIHCTKAIFECCGVIEVDYENESTIGLVHNECLQPIDRVLGIVKSEIFEKYDYLKNFDIDLWSKLRPHGQGFFNSMRESGIGNANIVHMGWSPVYETNSSYTYCIKTNLADGSIEYITNKGKVERLSLERAKQDEKFMNSVFMKAKREGDPFCYTSRNHIFGQYSLLLTHKEADEDCVECVSSEVVRFTRMTGKIYDKCEGYLAPVCILVNIQNEEPITINSRLVVISDPIQLNRFLENWKIAGLVIPEYEVKIIRTDPEYDYLVDTFLSGGRGVVINPLLDMRGILVKGILVKDIRGLEKKAV